MPTNYPLQDACDHTADKKIFPEHSANEAFETTLIDLLVKDPYTTQPRGQKIHEKINYHLIINPRKPIIVSEARKIKLSYLLAEWVWYMSGSTDIEMIAHHAPFWKTIVKDDGQVNSNYGARIFQPQMIAGGSQFDLAINTLIDDPDSRQAVLTINRPMDIIEGSKDIPCTMNIQFLIRRNRLHMIVNMRSNDIIMGFCNDVFQFSMFQHLLYARLKEVEQFKNLQLGLYYHNAGSMHIYEKHWPLGKEIIFDRLKDHPLNKKAEKTQRLQWINDIFKDVMPADTLEKDLPLLLGIESFLRKFSNFSIEPVILKAIPGFNDLSEYWQAMVLLCWSNNDSA